MKKIVSVVLWSCCVMTAAAQGLTDMSNSQQAKMNGLPLGSAKWTGGFWGDRFQLFSTTGVWSMWDTWNTPWETLDANGNHGSHGFRNFEVAASKASTTVPRSTTVTCISGWRPVHRSMP